MNGMTPFDLAVHMYGYEIRSIFGAKIQNSKLRLLGSFSS